MGLKLALGCCLRDVVKMLQSPALWPRLRESFPEIQDHPVSFGGAFPTFPSSDVPTETLEYSVVGTPNSFFSSSFSTGIAKLGDNGIRFVGQAFSPLGPGIPALADLTAQLEFRLPIEVISSRGVFFEFDTNLAFGASSAASRVSFREDRTGNQTIFINGIGWV